MYRIGLDGSVAEAASTGGFMYGLALDAEANVYACDFAATYADRLSALILCDVLVAYEATDDMGTLSGRSDVPVE